MRLSVVIPTLNRANLLTRTLLSIEKQTLSQNDFEILVIDNGSVDETKKVAHSFTNKIKNLSYFYQPEPGLHNCRHAGMRLASSDYLVFTDDDVEGFSTWFEAISMSFANSKTVMVGGNVLPKFEIEPPNWLIELWESKPNNKRVLGELSLIDLGNSPRPINPKLVFGCNFSIRKDILMSAGGFHPDGMPKDLIKYRGDGETHVSQYVADHKKLCMFNPKASIYHFVTESRMSFDYFYQRSFNQGVSNSYSQTRAWKKLNGYSNSKRPVFKLDTLSKIIRDFWLKNNNRYQLTKIIDQGLRDGFNYHQQLIQDDSALLEWVLKESYL